MFTLVANAAIGLGLIAIIDWILGQIPHRPRNFASTASSLALSIACSAWLILIIIKLIFAA